MRAFGARFTDANLEGTRLISAILSDADLRGARLKEADMLRAELNNADLTDANLYGANLVDALFIKADLTRADLKNANIWQTYPRRVCQPHDRWMGCFKDARLDHAIWTDGTRCKEGSVGRCIP